MNPKESPQEQDKLPKELVYNHDVKFNQLAHGSAWETGPGGIGRPTVIVDPDIAGDIDERNGWKDASDEIDAAAAELDEKIRHAAELALKLFQFVQDARTDESRLNRLTGINYILGVGGFKNSKEAALSRGIDPARMSQILKEIREGPCNGIEHGGSMRTAATRAKMAAAKRKDGNHE
jgi:hypothetical protein